MSFADDIAASAEKVADAYETEVRREIAEFVPTGDNPMNRALENGYVEEYGDEGDTLEGLIGEGRQLLIDSFTALSDYPEPSVFDSLIANLDSNVLVSDGKGDVYSYIGDVDTWLYETWTGDFRDAMVTSGSGFLLSHRDALANNQEILAHIRDLVGTAQATSQNYQDGILGFADDAAGVFGDIEQNQSDQENMNIAKVTFDIGRFANTALGSLHPAVGLAALAAEESAYKPLEQQLADTEADIDMNAPTTAHEALRAVVEGVKKVHATLFRAEMVLATSAKSFRDDALGAKSQCQAPFPVRWHGDSGAEVGTGDMELK